MIRVRPDSLTVAKFPQDLLDAKPEYRNLFIVRVLGGFLEEVVGVLQLAHQPQDEITVVVAPKNIRIDFGLLRDVLDVLPERARLAHALVGEAHPSMQGIETNDGRCCQLLVRFERPWGFQLFAKAFLELLEPARNQVVLAADGVLKPEVVEDGSQELAAFRMCEAVRYLEVCPESVLGQ